MWVLRRVYSCSIPNQGSSAAAFSMAAAAAARVLVGMGLSSPEVGG